MSHEKRENYLGMVEEKRNEGWNGEIYMRN